MSTAPAKGCPWYCNIPTGIPGLFVSAPGADCSGCNSTTDQGALNKVGQAVANPNSAVDQGAASALSNGILGPFMAALPGIGIHVGVFALALLLVIVGFWIVTSGGDA